MNTDNALAARVAALENIVMILMCAHAIENGHPYKEAARLYDAAYREAEKRLENCQAGPERCTAAASLRAMKRFWEQTNGFLTGG